MSVRFRVCCLLLLFVCVGVAKSQEAQLNAAMEKFKQHFNAQELDSIYAMAGPSFKAAINKATLSNVMKQYYEAFGAIDSVAISKSQGTIAVYTGYFNKGINDIAIRLNDDNLFEGFRFLPTAQADATPKMERNLTKMQFPLTGDWYVYWGGDTKAQNYHVIDNAQRRAFDLVVVKNNKSFERSGTRNEDYYAFGKPITAVCDATVVNVITGVHDNKPGEMNPSQALGNSVTLKTEAGEYIVYAHFQEGTLVVKEGDSVTKGQYLGNCGNSGNSTEPHLHLHIQDGLKMISSVGIKCFFESLTVNGTVQNDYSPVQGETISHLTN